MLFLLDGLRSRLNQVDRKNKAFHLLIIALLFFGENFLKGSIIFAGLRGVQCMIILDFFIVTYNKGEQVIFQALFEQDNTADSSVPVLKRVSP